MRSFFPRTVHEFYDARLEPARTIGEKSQFGDMPNAHPFLQFETNVAFGCFKASDGLRLSLGDVFDGAVDRDVDARRLCARVQRHFAYIAEVDARIGEFAFDHGADLKPER